MKHPGGCHCGNLRVEPASTVDPAVLELYACWRKYASVAAADPDRLVTIRVADERRLARYTFGPATADYPVCRDGGVYVAAVTREEEAPRAIVIVNALEDRDRFTRPPIPVTYDAESRGDRVPRRRRRWMPVTIATADGPAP